MPRARPSRRPRALRSKRSRAQAPRHVPSGIPYRCGDGNYWFSPKQPWKPKNAINPSKKRVPSEGDAFALSGMLGRPPETSATDEVRGSDEGPDAAICSAKVSAVAACTALPLAGPDKG